MQRSERTERDDAPVTPADESAVREAEASGASVEATTVHDDAVASLAGEPPEETEPVEAPADDAGESSEAGSAAVAEASPSEVEVTEPSEAAAALVEPEPDAQPSETAPEARPTEAERSESQSDTAPTEPELEFVAAAPTLSLAESGGEAEPTSDATPRPEWMRGIIIAAPAVVLTVLVTGVFYAFLLIEPSPRWVVLFGSVVAALSMDGVLRAARREAFSLGGLDTTVFLFLPALYALAAPVFLEHNVRGYWALPAGGLAGLGFGVLVTGLVSAVRPYDAARPFGRYVAATATYFVAFALLSLMYTFDLDVRPATIATGLIAALLAAELLRDGEIDQLETLVFAVATGVVVAEARIAMHYLPIDGHLAALTLLLAFYFVTGLLHAHMTRQLDRAATLEYVTIAVTGLVLVIGAQAAGVA